MGSHSLSWFDELGVFRFSFGQILLLLLHLLLRYSELVLSSANRKKNNMAAAMQLYYYCEFVPSSADRETNATTVMQMHYRVSQRRLEFKNQNSSKSSRHTAYTIPQDEAMSHHTISTVQKF